MMEKTEILLNVVNNTSIVQNAALFTNNQLSTSTNTQKYTWDVTSFSFLGEQSVSIEYKLIGVGSFTTALLPITTLTFQGVCDSLNAFDIGVFSTNTIGSNTYITVYSLTYAYGVLDLYNSVNILTLTYNGTSFPVSNPNSVSDWNVYFNTSVNALVPFNTVNVVGNVVTLSGGVGLALDNITTGVGISDVISIIDNYTVTSVLLGGCEGSPVTIVDLPNCRTLGNQIFDSCLALTSLNLPLVSDAGSTSFSGCTSLSTIYLPSLLNIGDNAMFGSSALTTIYMPLCTSLGSTTGDDGVFGLIIGNIITLTIPLATSTDGDVVTLQANNTVTLITT